MIYGSVCSGIEAATVAWHPLGWRPAFFSEIEKFPSAVLAHHYPDVPNLGDMTKFEEWPDAKLDVLVGGTPCQSFSVAGLRKGLDDARGNLMLVYAAIARRHRPKWLVWENVPGVLSSGSGRDFGSLLGLLSGQRVGVPVNGWKSAGVVPSIASAYGLAWRVLDAQYVRIHGFGRAVPQRRRRVFVVGYLGDWRRAAAVLFERASLSGNPAPRREAGQGLAPTLSARTKGGGGLGTDFECDGGLIANATAATITRGAESAGKGGYAGRRQEDDINLVARCVTARQTRLDAESETFVTQGVALRGREGGAMAELTGDVSSALRTGGGGGDKPHVLQPATAFRTTGNAGCYETGDITDALTTGSDPSTIALLQSWRVRRLLPVECARLQGFPDDYLDIQFRGKPAADGQKYKALGNSMAVNCMRWIGHRINVVSKLEM